MARIVAILLLSFCLATTAFSHGAVPTRIAAFKSKLSMIQTKAKIETTLAPMQTFATDALVNKLAMNSPEISSDIMASETENKSFMQYIWNPNTQLVVYLAVWYLGNIYYNIYNKKACNALGKNASGGSNLHWALSAVQLFVGCLFVVPMWVTGMRKSPSLTFDNWKELTPVGVWASLSHALSVLALGAGAVSFGQIVKSAEPVFAALTNAFLLKDIDHPMVYLALVPIIGGVGLASLKELSFSMTALVAASLANQAAAMKNVVSKGVMNKPWAKALGPQNTYAVINILALVATLPFVLFFDMKDFPAVYQEVVKAGKLNDVVLYSAYSGLAYYLYNEASFLALNRLNPVTHSVANTLKRVVIIVASSIVFKTPVSLLGGIGSGIAVLGTLLYSLAKNKFSKGKGHH